MMLTQSRLREVLSYRPETGKFIRISARSPGAKMGVAGGIDRHGYLAIRIDCHRYLAHRLAWLYVYGEWPDYEIDHVNGDRADNRLANLRLASRSQNKANSQKYRNNTSGFKGVYWRPDTSRWRAMIGLGGKLHHLGTFDTAGDAHQAYLAAAEEYFGDFASHLSRQAA